MSRNWVVTYRLVVWMTSCIANELEYKTGEQNFWYDSYTLSARTTHKQGRATPSFAEIIGGVFKMHRVDLH